ncbi:SbcC/MukB-like Walker B domain-containing protein [Tardiphaga sp. OK245]|uniref:SbcC/MukB-like Walker B domain-containing protein n=1 Tax=Tardiphaga sp. OK245 TaxID=1855306 RepID=UPI0008A75455|nr:SbcC/MukB-like Walker B domain-containing protein [Tardiphaga sp. OK245]SEH43236.1 P-loop containing region of AAA domain-containing protein [Tardiphaga sp. OK245]
MMELRRIVLINWHMMARADLDLAGDAAILGQNRSGKSTIIDLIQAIMAGGSSRLYKFNRSAGESGGKSDRTLGGYCLGQLNEDTFLRPSARSHIAIVFEDPEQERLPVSLGLSIEAARGQQTEVVGHFVAEGVRVHTTMLLEETDGALRPAPWQAIRRRLEQACSGSGAALHTPDDAKTFIREYMRVLFTGRRTSDPERFVRTFVAALSFTDIASVEQFVHRYLLEPKPIDIAELRDSIGRYQEIQKTIAELNLRLEALKDIQKQIGQFEHLLQEESTCRAIEKTAALVEALGGLMANVQALRFMSNEREKVASEFRQTEIEIARENDALASIQLEIAATGVAGKRAIVEGEIKTLDREHAFVAERLATRFLRAARAIQLLDSRDKLGVINPGELLQSLERVKDASRGLAPPDWPQDPATMERLLAAVADAATARMEKATKSRDDSITWYNNIEAEMNKDRAQLAEARRGLISLNATTTQLMDALRREGMRPRTLCEVADVLDETWRNAVESLLTRDREAIIVDPEHAYRATEILRHGRGAYPGCRVANTRRLQSRAITPESGTLASMIRSNDPLAMAFVVYRIGNVRLAADQQELLSGGRAVMADGAYYDGLITEIRRAEGAKIGRAAAPLMAAELQRRLDENEKLLDVHSQNKRFFEDVIRRLEDCSAPVKDGEQLDNLALALGDLMDKRTDARRRFEAISAETDPQLNDAEQRLKLHLSQLGKRRDDLNRRDASLGTEIEEIERKLGSSVHLLGSRDCLAHRRRMFRDAVASVHQLKSLREGYRRLRPRSPAKIAADMAEAANTAWKEHRALDQDIRTALGRYKLTFPDALEGYAEASITGTVKPWVRDGIATLEGNELTRYRQHADEAAERMSKLFKTNFIHELNNRFGQLDSEMEKLSAALKTRPLHGETYRLVHSPRTEQEDLYRLARDSESDETVLDALFGRAEPRDERHARALRQVEELLVDENVDFKIYQDYRSYFTYDLRLRDVATGRTTSFDRRRGVASGAERQVPFYVVIGAALASVYHGARQTSVSKKRGIGLAVFDEAFSKMDGPNQRTLLDFYREIGLQVVIAAPTEKRAAVYENLDYIIDVFRSGDVSMAESVKIKERVRTEMRAANPQHATDDELTERLALPTRAAE